MRIIETSHLKQWASTVAANSSLPQVIKKLINATTNVQYLRMPSGDASWVPDFDGVVINQKGTRFVPEGLSVWEMGTNSNYKVKANGDYDKRNDGKPQIDTLKGSVNKTEVIFIFVTPHIWEDKNKWIDEHKKDPVWKDIIVLDGVDLQDWLESSTPTSLNLAEEMSLIIDDGLQSLEQAWEEWNGYSDPVLNEDVVLAGREEDQKVLMTYLTTNSSLFTVRGDSPREAWGFVLASLRMIPTEEDRDRLCSRVIITDNEVIANRLRNLTNHIIILKQTGSQVSGVLARAGNHVILAEGNNSRTLRDVIELSRPDRQLFISALKKAGLSEDDARQKARECGLSTTILQRLLPAANYACPAWAEPPQINQLIPALLAGRWNELIEADQKVLCTLADVKEYSSVELSFQPFLSVDEPPLKKISEMWALTAPVDAFQLGARYITRTHFDRFKQIFIEVFGTIDPKVELPPDEWFASGLQKEKDVSAWLRSGLAESLLMIAEFPACGPLPGLPFPRDYVDEVVRSIPGLNNDWRVLASIRDQFTVMMEAAPRPLLCCLEHMLEATPEDLKRLFVEGDGIFGGGSMHTGILWSLEMLAWSPHFLPRVSSILAKLASIDPGGRLANRPINSLREIFLWWYPGTNANNEQRLLAIDSIITTEPEVGWKLLERLLPGGSLTASPTSKPRWRDFDDLALDSQTRKGQYEYLNAIIDRAINNTGNDVTKWKTLLDSMTNFNKNQVDRVIESLISIAHDKLSNEQSYLFWDMIRDFTSRHRAFHSAVWALPLEIIERFEVLLPLFAPEDIVERNLWLFNDWLPEISDIEEDIDVRKKKVDEQRNDAIRSILGHYGVEGIIKLGENCNYPGIVASLAVPQINNIESLTNLVHLAIKNGETGVILASRISIYLYQLFEKRWLDTIPTIVQTSDRKTTTILASMLQWLPDNREVWDFADILGAEVSQEFWRIKPIYNLVSGAESQRYQLDRLIKVGRAHEIFKIITYGKDAISSELLLLVFDATMEEVFNMMNTGKDKILGVDAHGVKSYLDKLRSRSEISKQEVIKREFNALPFLVFDSEGLSIHEYMAENPEFFVDLLCKVFITEKDKGNQHEPSAEELAWARSAHTILRGMDKIPGMQDDKTINEVILTRWIDLVRVKAKERDRSTVADSKIGELLARSPNDPEDGGWPHKTIRNVIEARISSKMEHGFVIGKYNMRGVVSRGLCEGGQQERELEKEYRKYVELATPHWPKTAAILETMAERWRREAAREDAEAIQTDITLY